MRVRRTCLGINNNRIKPYYPLALVIGILIEYGLGLFCIVGVKLGVPWFAWFWYIDDVCDAPPTPVPNPCVGVAPKP